MKTTKKDNVCRWISLPLWLIVALLCGFFGLQLLEDNMPMTYDYYLLRLDHTNYLWNHPIKDYYCSKGVKANTPDPISRVLIDDEFHYFSTWDDTPADKGFCILKVAAGADIRDRDRDNIELLVRGAK